MAQLKSKRSLPAPIFNKGKRPRVTLVAHPNNLGGISHEAIQSKENYHNDRSFNMPFQQRNSFASSSVLSNTQHRPFTNTQPRPSNNIQARPSLNPQSRSTGNSYNQHWPHKDDTQASHMDSVDHHKSYNTGVYHQGPNKPGSSLSNRRQTGQQLQKRQLHQLSSGPTPPSCGSYGLGKKSGKEAWPIDHTHLQEGRVAVGASVAKANEPNKTALVHVKKPPGVCDGVRVLTATAQGVRHWSQYREHTTMLFEVYGTLASVAVSRQHSSEQEFSIRTTDGVLQCVYWEMEVKFPVLERGRPVRVVGGWDPTHNRLKCYSVRPSRAGEEDTAVQQSVSVADRHMRRFVSVMKQQ